jgi:hypothetical protein
VSTRSESKCSSAMRRAARDPCRPDRCRASGRPRLVFYCRYSNRGLRDVPSVPHTLTHDIHDVGGVMAIVQVRDKPLGSLTHHDSEASMAGRVKQRPGRPLLSKNLPRTRPGRTEVNVASAMKPRHRRQLVASLWAGSPVTIVDVVGDSCEVLGWSRPPPEPTFRHLIRPWSHSPWSNNTKTERHTYGGESQ